jgi:RHS repeat-associated protein
LLKKVLVLKHQTMSLTGKNIMTDVTNASRITLAAHTGLLFLVNYRSSGRLKRSVFITTIFTAWLVICGTGTISAQNVQFTQNNADSALRSNVRVDPSTLGMNIQIPLRAYPGRAGTNLPITLHYSSKVWRIKYLTSFNMYTGYDTTTEAKYAEHSVAGWTSSLGVPVIEWTGGEQVYDPYGKPLCTSCNTNWSPSSWRYMSRIAIHMPDGSSHELRSSEAPTAGMYNTAGVFYAVDGSRLKYDTYTSTLYMPDGSRYILGGNNPQFIDRNGNTLTYNHSTGLWADTLGRNIGGPPLASYPGDYAYTLPGVGGRSDTYIFRWRHLADARTDPNQPLRYTGDYYLPNPASPPTAPDSGNYPAGPLSPRLFISNLSDLEDFVLSSQQLFNPVVLSEIVLPNGSIYKFTYNVYGEIDKVVFPTGGTERYQYAQTKSASWISAPYDQTNRGVISRWVSANGTGSDEVQWQYETLADAPTYTNHKVKTTAPDGAYTVRYLYKTGYNPNNPVRWGHDDARIGMPYDERVYSATGQLLRRKLTEWAVTSVTVPPQILHGQSTIATRDPRPTKVVEILLDTGGDALSSITTYQYDNDLNVTLTRQYNYSTVDQYTAENGAIGAFVPDPGLLSQSMEISYLVNNQAYRDRNLTGLPTSTLIRNSSGAMVSHTEMRYDETALLSYGAMPGWIDPATTARGNQTTTRRWLNTTGAYLESHIEYDIAGNPVKTIDPKGNFSQTEYSSSFAHAYPTRVRTPVPDPTGVSGSNAPLDTTYVYDIPSGLVLSSTDSNGQLTSFEYNDVLNRPTRVVRPQGGGQTNYSYGDTPGSFYVFTQTTLDATRVLSEYRYSDKLGRLSRTFKSEGDAPATWTVVDTQYDSLGRVWRVSNMYRASSLTAPVNPSGLWTTTLYDSLGRTLSITTPDGASIVSSYSGNELTVTDQAGSTKRNITDAFERLVQVIEDPNGLNHQTYYTYDALDNLTSVWQGGQTRSYAYDSLARLISITNPESGTISYQYDVNGNLSQRTDARGVVTTNVYDALNRVTSRTYSDGTPSESYVYDSLSVENSKGKLVSASSSVSSTHYDEFDSLGRVKRTRQVTDGYTHTMSYEYDLAGNMISQTYPSGRIITTHLDAAGRINSITGQKTGETAKTYVSSVSYAAHGAIEAKRLGNGLWEHTVFDNRQLPTQIGLGSSITDSSVLRLDYTYNTPGTTNNNGNVRTQTITVPGLNVNQSYTYDSLNRLLTAQENNGANWRQTFTYDRFGNRNFDAANTTPIMLGPNPTISLANNRYSAGQGYVYDAAGNLITDAAGHTYSYDAENRQTSYDGGAVTYSYDPSGKRVKKVAGGVTTIFVYNCAGQLLAEYTNVSPQNTSGTSYLTSDHQGSPRVITNAGGAVRARHDYLPFGEEINAPVGGRTTEQGYVGDAVRQKYTGYERDFETGLDYAQARYYSSMHGRFLSVDPQHFQVTMGFDPQLFNLYAYGRNNPLKFVDPNGERVILSGNHTWLLQMVLYEMAGGQAEFDRYFQVVNGEVLVRPGAINAAALNGSPSLAQLYDLVTSPDIQVWHAGVDGNAVAGLFRDTRNNNGRLNRRGENIRDEFNGRQEGQGTAGGYVLGTTGREGSYQPADFNGEAVFAVIAFNTNTVMTQEGVNERHVDSDGRIFEFWSQFEGLGQRVSPANFFRHEGEENIVFAFLRDEGIPLDGNAYLTAHRMSMATEGVIRRSLKEFQGGFAGGGNIKSNVPR